jgi:hypothetical protein
MRNKIYYIIQAILTILLILLGVCTLIPYSLATRECLLGYKAFCSFSPISTIICFGASQIAYSIGKKKHLDSK